MSEEFNFFPDSRLVTLIEVFHTLFEKPYNTRLRGGGTEPLYQPATRAYAQNVIVFRSDYLSSALHEIAHWCLAGESRRTLVDYGYWYTCDGRNDQQQVSFEQVEAKPQAIERIFSHACGHRFRISVDNLDAKQYASSRFIQEVQKQTLSYCERGLPRRARQFAMAAAQAYGVAAPFHPGHFVVEELW